MFVATFKTKNFFFDRPKVRRMIANKKRRALSKIGAFIRQRARTSLRRRKKVAPVGMPPSVHSKDRVANLKNILFAYEPAREAVLVGPVALNQQNYLGPQLGTGTVPQIHEFGGTVGFREKKVGNRWTSAGRRRPRPGQPTRVRTARYEARPFMGPALNKELPNIPAAFRGSLRG